MRWNWIYEIKLTEMEGFSETDWNGLLCCESEWGVIKLKEVECSWMRWNEKE